MGGTATGGFLADEAAGARVLLELGVLEVVELLPRRLLNHPRTLPRILRRGRFLVNRPYCANGGAGLAAAVVEGAVEVWRAVAANVSVEEATRKRGAPSGALLLSAGMNGGGGGD